MTFEEKMKAASITNAPATGTSIPPVTESANVEPGIWRQTPSGDKRYFKKGNANSPLLHISREHTLNAH